MATIIECISGGQVDLSLGDPFKHFQIIIDGFFNIIPELIKIPNTFFDNNDLENSYLISSLFGRSLFLTNFDEKFTKVNFLEKIYIGERIRDLVYLEKENIVLLSLENPTRIGILK